ncbi:PfkB family carbohydrate kinase [Roseibium sp.]|uniref:PfkB family carbohydrate kinase n=1 Tax=Roseibium sp. TaxID=1936156 RepID=UPI003B503AD4
MPTVICAGLITLDAVYELTAYPKEGSKMRANAARLVPGGGALLAATAIARLGGKARLAGAVGDDLLGEHVRDHLKRRGIDDSLVQTLEGETTSHSVVLVTENGERTIVNRRSDRLPDLELTTGIPDHDAILADTRCRALASGLFQAARQDGKPTVLDGEVPLPVDLLPAVSHLAVSEQGLAGFHGKSLAEIAAQHGCWACVTRGAATVQVHDGTEFAPPTVTALDTLGAGDVWHGAFAFALAGGSDEPYAVRFANAAAALFVSRAGEGRYPTLKQVEDKLDARTEPDR